METILIQAAVGVTLLGAALAVAWCRARSAHLQVAQKELDEYHRAAMALINDENVPFEAAEFAYRIGKHLNNPGMARHVVRSIKSGRFAERTASTESPDPQDNLAGKALENFSKVIVYGTLISASHDLFLARRWRSIILFALTKPVPVKAAVPTVKTTLIDVLAAKIAAPPLTVGLVDTGRAPELAKAMACA